MAVVHRKLDGGWADCPDESGCELIFHFPDITVAEAQALPLRALLPLLEIIEPPVNEDHSVVKAWMRQTHLHLGISELGFHRDYDLPALIGADGKLGWYQHDEQHRDGDKPAEIWADGTQKWWRNGLLHREGNKPAVIHSNGITEYWLNGVEQRWDGVHMAPRYSTVSTEPF